ncbi:hypothetical protein NED98_05640 [Sphingomonas sp. MMSM20]|uniref:hypothetical protein n=1 Tax=Sphingomonas lycopersici TaxID=2951807 RepID=UPI0022379446|nr:hypothetical protein [Sphingomonas lycopersici]MCW6529722.1 hypothetical protein [Sphingomonas lycopersici]
MLIAIAYPAHLPGWCSTSCARIKNMPDGFPSARDAARALIHHADPKLTRRSGQFLGGLLFDPEGAVPTERQRAWLADLLRKHGLPPLADGGANA